MFSVEGLDGVNWPLAVKRLKNLAARRKIGNF